MMPNPKYTLSDIMREIREIKRVIYHLQELEKRVTELEISDEEWEWTEE